jgi:hypothetical protein
LARAGSSENEAVGNQVGQKSEASTGKRKKGQARELRELASYSSAGVNCLSFLFPFFFVKS